MREFLNIINEMIGQFGVKGCFDADIIAKMSMVYQSLAEKEKQESILILDELLQEDYRVYFSVMSALLTELKDERIRAYIKKQLLNREYPLWERYGNMRQMEFMLFQNLMPHWNEEQKHKDSKEIYKGILAEIQQKIGAAYPYIPYDERKKTVVISVIQLLGVSHAPTKVLIDYYRLFSEFGYNVKVFVCFYPGKVSTDNIFWYEPMTMHNIMQETAPFTYDTGSEKINGYNLILDPADYIQRLREAVGMVWDEKPEFVFEIGEETMLAGLCGHFTTVVTMGVCKNVPITTAPVLASYFTYSKEELEKWISFLDENQQMVDVACWSAQNSETKLLSKKDFGISDDRFVIIIAGNRLDTELTGEFWNIIYRILEMDKRFLALFIGHCPESKEKAEKEKYAEQTMFAGYVKNFRGTVAVGDVFLNPPRQGGGTGGNDAMLTDVPVITLNNCDIASLVGNAFVCDSIEEMPSLVYRYFSDEKFMQQQKEACRKMAAEKMNVDSYGNIQRMLDVIQKVAGKEEGNES